MRVLVAVVLVAFMAGCGGSSAPSKSRIRKRKRRRPTSLVTPGMPTTPTTTTTGTSTTGTSQQPGPGEIIPGQERVPIGASKELWDAWKNFEKDYVRWRKKWDAMLSRKLEGQEISRGEIESMLNETGALQRRMVEVRQLAESLKGKDSFAENVMHAIDRDAAVTLGRARQTLLDWRSAGR